MMELIQKLPDSASGVVLAAGLWMGFNLAVLGPREMEKDISETLLPSCMASLDAQDAVRPDRVISGVFKQLGLGDLGEVLSDMAGAPVMTKAQKLAACQCGVLQTRTASRLDYALHTATFRTLDFESLRTFRSTTAEFVLPSQCRLTSSVMRGVR